MRFYSEEDHKNYREFLLKEISQILDNLVLNDSTIKAAYIGMFPDRKLKFMTCHPFLEERFIRRKEYDIYASLLMDIMPFGTDFMIIEVANGSNFS